MLQFIASNRKGSPIFGRVELLVKLYADKPSRIAVKYIYEFQAVKTYEEILRKSKGRKFKLRIELLNQKASLTLTSIEDGTKIEYKGLDFRIDPLKKLQDHAGQISSIHFVHVFPKANSLMVAKPFKKQDFMVVEDYEIIHH